MRVYYFMATGTVTHKDSEMTVDPQLLRMTMRLWGSGVTVVTAAHEGQRMGVTVSSLTSVSLTPPLILVCLYKNTDSTQILLDAGHFAVSILADGQGQVAEQFAGHNTSLPEGADRFYNVPISTQTTGAPVLDAAIAWLDCRIQAAHDGGTHWIVVGEVLATGRREGEPDPLIYYNRSYRSIVS
jgi:flavin reductase (DIM6/NTAB) family NADH-FMN oxidoreductase RutF